MEFNEIISTSIRKILKLYFGNLKYAVIFVIVIGANNGELKDSLNDYLALKNVKGILVEPISYLYKELQEKYSDNKKFHIENSALYRFNCKKNMFRLNQFENMPEWANGLGTFFKEPEPAWHRYSRHRKLCC